ncbi:MAG: CvpA family protein [Mogibacterium sp.]|nr:CvpA family protein [Mogibacterium sp.]
MVLDAIIILIFLISVIRGKNKGVGETVIRLGALILSVYLGVKFNGTVSEYLCMTPLDEILAENLRKLAQSDTIDLVRVLPGKLGNLIVVLGGDQTVEVTRCTELLMLVLSFVLIVLVVWILSSIIRGSLRRSRESGGFVGTVDSAIGFLFGALRGALLVFLMLALMMPVAGIFMPDKIPAINQNLDHSFIAGYLYDNNPIVTFLEKKLPQ